MGLDWRDGFAIHLRWLHIVARHQTSERG